MSDGLLGPIGNGPAAEYKVRDYEQTCGGLTDITRPQTSPVRFKVHWVTLGRGSEA